MKSIHKMSDEKEQIVKVVTTAAMISILTGLARALYAQKVSLLARIWMLAASTVFGVLVGVIIKSLDLSDFKRSVIVAASAAFGHSILPVLEKIVVKWITKKGEKVDDILHNNSD